jgi:DNA-binding Lrp family transcriptional regulator
MMDKLLVALQCEIPLVRRPFAALGEQCGRTEMEVLDSLKALFDTGKARRFGGVFDTRAVGYRSALCACTVPVERMDEVAARVCRDAGVTHCYERGWPGELPVDGGEAAVSGMPNLWFTISHDADSFDAKVASLRNRALPYEVLLLPAVRQFKVQVVFGAAPGSPVSCSLSPTRGVEAGERPLGRILQGQLPLVPKPFDVVADQLGWGVERVLDTLREWKDGGVLRRVGVILHHRRVGYEANGMCVWRVASERIADTGRVLADAAEVTHCYQREESPSVPYNLYAMVHAARYTDLLATYARLSEEAQVQPGAVLFSLREFKKTSPAYFAMTSQHDEAQAKACTTCESPGM